VAITIRASANPKELERHRLNYRSYTRFAETHMENGNFYVAAIKNMHAATSASYFNEALSIKSAVISHERFMMADERLYMIPPFVDFTIAPHPKTYESFILGAQMAREYDLENKAGFAAYLAISTIIRHAEKDLLDLPAYFENKRDLEKAMEVWKSYSLPESDRKRIEDAENANKEKYEKKIRRILRLT
jgi:hypothetical protein